jgi:hypothetical protein
MNKALFAIAVGLMSTAAIAQTPQTPAPQAEPKAAAPKAAAPASPTATPGTTCTAQAAEKRLAGAARNSFMKKCEADASKACEEGGKAQNLRGAAKNSHMKKCVSDAVGA